MKSTGRRRFLKTLALAGGTGRPGEASSDQAPQEAPTPQAQAGAAFDYPRSFSGRQLAMVAFPLGGIGSGSISLGGRGQLRDWQIFNRPERGKTPQYAFAAIWAKCGGREPVSRVLESALLPPYEGATGLGFANVPGLPRLESAVFRGEYPMATVEFQDSALPVRAALEAFTPFIPLEPDDSGLPVVILRYRVRNPAAQPAAVSVAFSIDNPVGATGRMNELRDSERCSGLLMRNPALPARDPLAGSFALAIAGADSGKLSVLRGWRGGTRWRIGPLLFWDDFSSDGELGPEEPVRNSVGSVCLRREIGPRASADFCFLLGWHFPNRTPERCGWNAPPNEEQTIIGNYYCRRFPDAWAAVEYAAANLPDLEKRTREFVTALGRSTVPAAVRDAAAANLSTLATPTCFRTADGEFHGFEGAADRIGCCFGSCTHVWNYEVATSFLFPSLSRSLREAALGFCTDGEGRMDFRQLLPAGKQNFGRAAADGQMSTILKLYLDWRLSGDTEWLKQQWPAAKRALEFAWAPGGWDADRDGVMEGAQHNTYDVEFFGPNPLCGVWYLGALRAAEEMARALGDEASAQSYRKVFANGSRWIDENLFNGEYYIQKVRGLPRDKIAKGLVAGEGVPDTENPEFQACAGCVVNQLAGQYLADIAGLGNLLDPRKIRKALKSIYSYNFKANLRQYPSVQRTYAINDEAGLINCAYPRGGRPRVPFPYFSEVWSGLEYAAAALMIYRGMVREGIHIVESVRRRHDGERRNPWSEPECGHHYARALSAWAPLVALSGFHYDGCTGTVTARPKIRPEAFSCIWSGGAGWGVFSHSLQNGRRRFTLWVKGGHLACGSVILGPAPPSRQPSSVRLDRKQLPHKLRATGDETYVILPEKVVLSAGSQLSVLV